MQNIYSKNFIFFSNHYFGFKSLMLFGFFLFQINTSFCQSVTNNYTVAACNSYVLPWTTTAITSSGIYTNVYPLGGGFDSTVNINVTINASPTASVLSAVIPTVPSLLINEQFEHGLAVANAGTTYTPVGWFQTNKSNTTACGTCTNWMSAPFLTSGTPTFAAQSGTGCMAADYRNIASSGTISNWLISPVINMKNGDSLTFWSIQNPGTPYPDRLEIRRSILGTSTNVGTSATTVGDFSTLLLSINPTLSISGYPQVWTKYTVVMSGITGTVSGRIAFRYFVIDGGINGNNSDMIGLDNVQYKTFGPAPVCANVPVNLKTAITGGASPYSVVINKSTGGNVTQSSYLSNANITINPNVTTTYTLTSVTDANGCTSANLSGIPTVTVTPNAVTNFSVAACDSYILPWTTIPVTISGIYSNSYATSLCDSIVNYNVTINNALTNTINVSSCNSYTLPWTSIPVTTSGTYSNTYTASNTCDSIVVINVTINSPITTTNNTIACNTYSLPWNIIVNATGLYSHIYNASNGCDSTSNINVTINNNDTTNLTASACLSYALPWGATANSSGLYTHIYTSQNLCDSIVNYNITIFGNTTTSLNISACSSYLLPWGITKSTSGIYNNTYQSVNGCDSLVSINLNILQPVATTTNVNSCISFILPWSTTPVASSGLYSHTYTGTNGCDSISNINVTIYNPSSSTISLTACNSFELPWNLIVTSSGNYSNVYTNSNGCDSTSIIILTINSTDTTNLNVSSCLNYTLPWGTIVINSGLYSHIYLNHLGCDSLVNINVNINSNSISNLNINACDSIILPWGINVNTSGIYSHTYQNSFMCDSIVNLNVTIHNSQFVSSFDTSFVQFTTPWGSVETSSGIYSNIYTNVNGCDSTRVIHLYINPGVSVNIKAFLSGPFIPGINLMHDSLRAKNLLPIQEPYSFAPFNAIYTHVNGGGNEMSNTGIFNITGNDAIVDWVFVELRSKTNPSVVTATKSALIQRDGDVAEAEDGISPLKFLYSPSDEYYISIKHRNHLGVMTLNKFLLSESPTNLDFTSQSSIPLFTKSGSLNNAPLTGPTRIQSGKRTLYAGNCNIDLLNNAYKFISYSNFASSDRTKLFTFTGGVNTILGYLIYDLDCNGLTRFNGLTPDRQVILTNCVNLNSLIVNEQLP